MYKKDFAFWMPTNIHFGEDASMHMNDLIVGDHVMMIVSKTLYKNGSAKRIALSLGTNNITMYDDVESDPSTDCVDRAVAKAKEVEATTIIGIGGGSCMDVAKAVACLASEQDHILTYLGKKANVIKQRKRKLILVPTTAGTGSEVTNIGVFTNSSSKEKLPIASDQFYADDAIIDPLLTCTMPDKVCANTGMDAFCHALESYWNRNSNPISDTLAIQALQLILHNLKIVYDHPNHQSARGNMMLASMLAGMAFTQTKTTAAHAISYPLSAKYHVTHGEACAITLPALIRLSHELAAEKMSALEAELGFADQLTFADAVEQLLVDIKMPIRLSQLGAAEQDINQLVQVALAYQKQLDLTPVTLNAETLSSLISSLI